MPTFSSKQLEKIGIKIFEAAGVSEDEAQTVATFLVKSNLVGHDSHGVIRIPQYINLIKNGMIKPGVEIEIIRETPSTAVIDGKWGFGQVVASRAMAITIEKAKKTSISSVGTNHCNHVGRLSDYAMMAAKQEMIGMMTVNNHGAGLCAAPYGGYERRLSTNPICFAIPTGNDPIVMDITSSVVAEGKLRVKRNRGEKIPEGWIVDGYGNPSTEPEDFYKEPQGALLPFGGMVGYKGFGLSMIIDILSGGLSHAGCSRRDAERIGNGLFMEVINISSFVPIDEFYAQVNNLIEFVKSSKLAPGFDEILIPGEPEMRVEQERSKNGIFVDDETWRQIKEVAQELDVEV